MNRTALTLAAFAAAAAAQDRISEHRFTGHVRFLADDLLEGRGVGSRGDELARLYLATQMQGAGLQPAGVEGGWEQPVPIVGVTSKVVRTLSARPAAGGEAVAFAGPEDFTARAGRHAGSSVWAGAELVFVGYGITAKEQDWDDYGSFDVRGKVLLVMNNDPSSDEASFAGERRLYYGRWSYKYEEAARRGAAGVLVIHTTPSAGYPFQVIQAGHEQEAFHLPQAEGDPSVAIEGWCSEDAARRLCAVGGQDLDRLRAAAEQRGFTPVPLGVKVDLELANRVRSIRSANVAGLLPGSDPALADQVVVVTAHFDHLGIGPERKGDAIYNGAVDNATGTAGLLCLAQACAGLSPRRSILFLAVTAEESGLLGSLYYARNPTFAKERLVADVNIDGLNIWGRTRDIEMIGYGKSSLTATAERAAARRGRTVKPNGEPDKGYFYRSDHFSFARIGVPSVYFKAGSDFLEKGDARRRIKAMYTTVYYHQPSDEYVADRWQADGATADLELLLDVLLEVAQADQAPTWTPGDEFEKLR